MTVILKQAVGGLAFVLLMQGFNVCYANTGSASTNAAAVDVVTGAENNAANAAENDATNSAVDNMEDDAIVDDMVSDATDAAVSNTKSNAVKARAASSKNTAVNTAAGNASNNELLVYVKDVLQEAGFTNAVRDYLVSVASQQLLKVSARDFSDKQRLLKRNLFVFLNNVSEKKSTPTTLAVVRQQYYLANQTDKPWEYILSSKVLAIFKANHIFDHLDVSDIEGSNAKFCPVWPFCKE